MSVVIYIYIACEKSILQHLCTMNKVRQYCYLLLLMITFSFSFFIQSGLIFSQILFNLISKSFFFSIMGFVVTVKALNQARLEANVRVYGDEKHQKRWPSPYSIASGLLLLLSFLKFVYSPLKFLALGAVAAGVFPIILKAIVSIRNFRFDINILVIIAGNSIAFYFIQSRNQFSVANINYYILLLIKKIYILFLFFCSKIYMSFSDSAFYKGTKGVICFSLALIKLRTFNEKCEGVFFHTFKLYIQKLDCCSILN